MLLAELVETHAEVAATRSRKIKTAALAARLSAAQGHDLDIVVAYLGGTLRQRRTGLGWRGLSELPAPAASATLEVREVHDAFQAISELSGAGSQSARRAAVEALFGRATEPEQAFLRGLVTGELRQGALDSLVQEGLARAAGVPLPAVRRAAMMSGSTVSIAAAAFDGVEALEEFRLEVGRPVLPMLASSAPTVTEALAKVGAGGEADDAVVDTKLDGIRVQVHRAGDAVRVATRTLDDITERLPEVVDLVRALPADRLVLDGEALLLGIDERPRAFQETASRTATHGEGEAVRAFFFDLLHLDGTDFVDRPLAERLAALDDLVPEAHRVARLVTGDPDAAEAFARDAVVAGYEGVVVKQVDAPYAAGRRGSAWVKVKPVHTLDLVVLAVEWGSGRRRGWLSNIHLGARDPDTGGFVMLGKTFKGMTDEMLAWQTERFSELETSRDGHVVHVRPEQVVEIAFDGLQRSTRYAGGLALRFARVVRYRDDKSAGEADTIDAVRALAG